MWEQIAIAGFGTIAAWLSQDHRENWRKWASVFGLCGEPFWIHSAWASGQWGIMALCSLYTLAWIRGFYNGWIRKDCVIPTNEVQSP